MFRSLFDKARPFGSSSDGDTLEEGASKNGRAGDWNDSAGNKDGCGVDESSHMESNENTTMHGQPEVQRGPGGTFTEGNKNLTTYGQPEAPRSPGGSFRDEQDKVVICHLYRYLYY
jgi:hypothetical protein